MGQAFDNHFMVQAGTAMQEICSPIEESFNITDFAYEKIYKDNKKIKLTNRTAWLEEYYKRGFHLMGLLKSALKTE